MRNADHIRPRPSAAEIISDTGYRPDELRAFCERMAQVLALPPEYADRIQAALAQPTHLRVIWLSGQDCAGDTEALLRVAAPPLDQVLLDYLSLEYHELLMGPSGRGAEELREEAVRRFPQGYVAVVEGSIPTAEGGVYCTVGGRAFADIVREVCEGAIFTIAAGSCAWDGGLPAAMGAITGAVGVEDLLPKLPIVNLPGCPINGENLLAVIVFYLTFHELPPMDVTRLPLFAYGSTVHASCERLPHFKAREFAKEFGDEGYRQGYCLLNLGCKGIYAFANCPVVEFNDGQSWCVAAGAPCAGCTLGKFWDEMTPFYQRGRARLAHGRL